MGNRESRDRSPKNAAVCYDDKGDGYIKRTGEILIGVMRKDCIYENGDEIWKRPM